MRDYIVLPYWSTPCLIKLFEYIHLYCRSLVPFYGQSSLQNKASNLFRSFALLYSTFKKRRSYKSNLIGPSTIAERRGPFHYKQKLKEILVYLFSQKLLLNPQCGSHVTQQRQQQVIRMPVVENSKFLRMGGSCKTKIRWTDFQHFYN